ncbi:hypothetical protein ZIOFF_023553 [Zingiber officinale]|uniref:Photosystem II 10 kDa polypeptide, chloroplastic n=1 Tax=Zingiber officinale TaxID=94328 RepID=A0A8J5L5M5_ZINOF|nr:hypothetical protein ZIOFF_023553 [Zingiber officinale]
MAASLMSSSALKPPAPASLERLRVNGVPALVSRSSSSSRLKVEAKGGKLKTDKPYGINGGMALPSGLDASGRKQKGKGVYQFVDNPIYNTDDWSPSGDVYVGGSTGLLIWAVTLAGILAGGALLVYNTSALAQ